MTPVMRPTNTSTAAMSTQTTTVSPTLVQSMHTKTATSVNTELTSCESDCAIIWRRVSVSLV